MAKKLARRLMWALVGSATSKAVRSMTRRAMHDRNGTPKLPRPVRRRNGMGTALTWAIGTGAMLALADVLSEQGKKAARAR
ncbi:MAG TPA: hypothetical protein VFX98_04220 [Longimicrobiaceae bacterium]|nr:hypothetical protein [Longimicrobiaceae bacterium]